MLMTALLLAGAWAGAAGYEMRSYVMPTSRPQAALTWCDAPNGVLALTADVGKTDLLIWEKSRAELRLSRQIPVTLGRPDPGAGQIYTPFTSQLALNRAGQKSGLFHTSNVENVQDPAYRMTKTGEFKLGNEVYKCRYVKDAAFMGVTNKRTVIIWEASCNEPIFCKMTYATRNFDGSTGVLLRDGQKGYASTRTVNGGITAFERNYRWETPDGYGYAVKILSAASGPSISSVSVYKNGQHVSTEPFLAYSISLPKASK